MLILRERAMSDFLLCSQHLVQDPNTPEMRSLHIWNSSVTESWWLSLICASLHSSSFLTFLTAHQAHALYIIDKYDSDGYYMMPNPHDVWIWVTLK